MNIEEFKCPARDIIFKIGQRCHWFKYSFDQIPVEGGLGTIVEIMPIYIGNSNYISLLVLTDTGELESFPSNDVDPDFENT